MSHRGRLRALILCVALATAGALVATGCGGGGGGSSTTSADTAAATEPTGETTTEAATETAGGETATEDAGAPLVVNAPVGPATLDLLANACGFHDQWAANLYAQITQHPPAPGPTEDAFGKPLEGLTVTVMDTEQLVPDLADWETSDDGTVYTLHLNPDAKFDDGTPIDSAAVKFSLERALTLASCGSYFWIAGQYDNVPTVETPDAETVVLTFSRPEGALLAGWATTPSSVFEPSAVAEHPDTEGAAVNEYWASHVAGGGGPYLLDEYEPNTRMTMHANPDYFGDAPLSENVIVNFINSEQNLLLQARSGEADVTYELSPEGAASLEGDPNVNVIQVPAFQHWNVNLNWKIAPLDNVKVREALTYAVPYEDILEQVAKGFGTLYYGPLAQNLRYFNQELSAPRTFDLEKAQSLLAESGVATPLSLELVVQQGSGVPERVATILQSVWKQIGIDLKVTKLGPTEYNETVESHKAQMSIRLDGPGAPDPGWLLGYDMMCGNAFNLSDICIPEADELLATARTSTDPAEQQQLYDQITELWRAESPKIILYGVNQVVVLNKRVKTFHWTIYPGFPLDLIGK